MDDFIMVRQGVEVLQKYFPEINFCKPLKRFELKIMWRVVAKKQTEERIAGYVKIAAEKGIIPGCRVLEPHKKNVYVVSTVSAQTGMVSLKDKKGSYSPLYLELAK